MAALLEANHVSRFYNRQCAVNDISFTLNKGEVLGFLGPNGAGKTTTMQMLCGNLAPSTGQIKINGFDIIAQPVPAKRNLGYLPDTPPLYKELTVEEFLAYCARLHGLPKADVKNAVGQAQDRCGLNNVSGRLIGNLSKGYQQRAGIAQAILHNPPVIILDEPTVGLDPIQIREIRTLIRELGRDHGVILSTHILSEVQESCSHVQIIHQGKLVLKETIIGLNRHMSSGLIKLVTQTSIPADAIVKLTGIHSVEFLAPNIAHIYHDAGHNPADEIARTVVNQGCGLLELTIVKKSMEDIFIQLTQEASANE